MIVLIPSFEPDDRLEQIVGDLITQSGLHVVVVDDGSGPEYADHMSAVADLGATVLTHPVNRGKGAALRTGIEHILQAHPGESVVCADSDGQHSPVDVLRVAARLDEGDSAMVLGVRRFTGRVPMRSRVGNGVTARLFRALTGISLGDTQTGLRAYPAATLPWLLTIPGDRFEWELRVLLAAARDHRPIEQVEIATIYLEENASSHFRPLQDSARIYRQLLGFASSSLAGFALDAALLAVLVALGVPLVWSVLAARVVSASANYALNRRWVFGRGQRATHPRLGERHRLLGREQTRDRVGALLGEFCRPTNRGLRPQPSGQPGRGDRRRHSLRVCRDYSTSVTPTWRPRARPVHTRSWTPPPGCAR
jgi:glycosyltransferase involved in cell wall biosynthesis